MLTILIIYSIIATGIIGYLLSKNQVELPNIAELTTKTRGIIKGVTKSKPTVGAIQTPTAQEIYLREHPEVLEELEQMRETFKGLKVDEQSRTPNRL